LEAVKTLLKLKVSPKISFFNLKKLSLKFSINLKKMKFEKRAPSSTAEFHQLSETFIKKFLSFILKKKTHPKLRYMEGNFN